MVKRLLLIAAFLLLILAGLRLLSSSSGPEKPTASVPRLVQKKIPFQPPPLTLEAVFDSALLKPATLSAEKITTLVTTGDVGLVRSVNLRMSKRNDFTYPFSKITKALKEADLTLINLEGPLIKNCPLTNTGMIFCGDLRRLEGLVSAGVDLVNLANNHILDQGKKGLKETIEGLAQINVTPVEPEKIATQNAKTQRFAFLGYEDVNHKINEEKLKTQVQEANSLADIVIVSFHWGREYTPYPTNRQQELARLAVDSGADLVIGHHPHWVQPLEIYQGKLVVYSQGNFIFDQLWSRKTREGIIGQYLFYEDRLIDAELLPIFINDDYQPFYLDNQEREVIIEDLKQRSFDLAKAPTSSFTP